MILDNLNESNYILIAAKAYDNPSCTDMAEFHEDLSRIKYLKRLFKRYRETGDLKERLILNHLIILYNVFHHSAITPILLMKLDGYWDYLKPFLIYLNFWPEDQFKNPMTGQYVRSSDVEMDQKICNALRKL